MLTLARYAHESIRISGPATITILRVHRGKVWVGLEGPAETEFVRTEIQQWRGRGRNARKEAADDAR